MKKVLMVLGVLFVIVVVGFIGLLVWAQRSGGAHQEKFFQAVLSGDAKQVIAQFHPELRKEVDEPVLAAWMQAVKANLGAFKGLRKTDFHTSVKQEGGTKVTESTGTVDFEKGSAKSELVLHGDQIVKFNVTSDQIAEGWFKGPASTELYREQGKAFLTNFLTNQPDKAFQAMHKALQEKVPLDALKTMIDENVKNAGALKSVTQQSESYDAEKQSLKILYKVECEKAQVISSVKFQFVGLKGHLVAFNLNEEAK